MTDHAYVALIDSPQQFDQVEDFIAALVREGAGYANDIGVLDAPNHFGKGALLVLFTADRGLIDACFHLEFGFDAPLHFEHLDAFETEGDEFGAEIVGFRSLADEAGDAADTPEQVFDHVRTSKGWARGPRREAHADPVAYEEAADDWNRRLSEMLPVAAARPVKAAKRARPTAKAVAKQAAGKPATKSAVKPLPQQTARKQPAAAGKPARKKQAATAKPAVRAVTRPGIKSKSKARARPPHGPGARGKAARRKTRAR
jgi:hypothetical protein